MSAPRLATRDPRLAARVVERTALHFSGGADEGTDRTGHVRAGSGLARVVGGLVVIQDDSNFLALIDPARPKDARAIPLPVGADGRRQFGDSLANKHLKLDLEACVAVETPYPLIVGFGSGSTPARESIVLVRDWDGANPQVRLVNASGLYAALREAESFSGSEMNIEGAVLACDALRLFGRGNGATTGTLQPLNATCDIPWTDLLAYLDAPDDAPVPRPLRIRQYSLGGLDGVPLGFTDAAGSDDAILFTAAAERSPDAVRDGPVSGSVIGIITDDEVRWAPIAGEDESLLREKAEGLTPAGGGSDLWVVADADDERRPSELLRVRLEGPWRDGA